ncbi:hypothetical protein BS47DRAFT_1336711 [Hydnum rufescens UP504]|uniref:Uncharacterized protein n=1 Tax=Hydnum rufescens UP504 TaxID=1448309 RepID=A0A9P6B8M3_9AGAM|nr:hypothetical protein BS47DRAFT_1336711 [Hydnum rufescens UP504]
MPSRQFKVTYAQSIQICYRILSLTSSRKIPGVILSLVLAQIAGSITWTVGTVTAKLPVDMRAANGMTMAGTLLCTIGASLCSMCILISLIVIIYDNPLWSFRARRGLLIDLQMVSMRVHIPVILVTVADLVSYLLFPKSHASMVMAILIGKIWSNTLLHGLNSRQAQRANWRNSRSIPESETMQSVPGWWRRNPHVRDDDLGMELADMGRSGDGSAISSLMCEQDITSVQITEVEKAIGEVGDHQPTYVLFGEHPNLKRISERHERRSSAPI